MPKLSAGLLLFRFRERTLEVLLVHPGGPFWAKKDDGVWSIPKGEYGPGEDAMKTALREFTEETGYPAPSGEFIELSSAKQPSGKVVTAWAVEADVDAAGIRSNTFSMEWPPRSGESKEFPEVDRAGWFGLDEAKLKILKGQQPFLSRLEEMLIKKQS